MSEDENIDPLMVRVKKRINRAGPELWEDFCYAIEYKRYINCWEIRDFHNKYGIRYEDLLLFLLACGCEFSIEELRSLIDHDEEIKKGMRQC